jgi:hypothetical protein
MPENPKEVHPKGCGTSGLGVEEMSTEVTIDQEHNLGGRQWRYSQNHHPRHDQVEPS